MLVDLPGQSAEPVDLGSLSEKEVVKLFCANPKEEALATELWRRFDDRIYKALQRLIFRRDGLCPDFCDRKTFLDSTFTRAYLKFFGGIRDFRGFDSPWSLKAWLTEVASTAALDEWRSVTRPKIREVPLGDVLPEEVGRSLEESEAKNKSFRSRLLSFYGSAQKIPPPDAELKAGERKFVVREALVRYAETSQEAADSARAIRLWCWKNWTMTRIAEYFFGESATEREKNTKLKAVCRELASDFKNLRVLLEEDFGITSLQQV